MFWLFCFNSRLRSKSNIIQEPSDKFPRKKFSVTDHLITSNLTRKHVVNKTKHSIPFCACLIIFEALINIVSQFQRRRTKLTEIQRNVAF